jgi:branched-chain amino acid transport system substrate-binding protein
MNIKQAIVALIALFAFCGSALLPARAANPYVISVILSLSGGAAVLGAKEAASLRALEGMVNASGGVRGRSVHFDIADDASNPQTAAQLVAALAANNVPFVVGPTLSAACEAVAPIADAAGLTTFCLSPAYVPRAGGHQFVSTPSIDDVQTALFRSLLQRKLTRIAVMTTTDASGTDFDQRIAATLAQPAFANVTIVDHEHFAPTDTSVATQMARIKAAAPQALLTFTVGVPFVTLLAGVRDAGLDVPVYAAGGNFTYDTMQADASFLPRELFLNGSRGIATDPIASGAMKKAQDQYAKALANAGLRSEFGTAIPWDPMMLMLEVVRRAGTDANAAKIAATLAGLKGWTGIAGTYDFSTRDQRGLGQAAAAFFRYDTATNAFVQVYPTTHDSLE